MLEWFYIAIAVGYICVAVCFYIDAKGVPFWLRLVAALGWPVTWGLSKLMGGR